MSSYYCKLLIFAAASPIVHSKYLRQLEGTNSSDYEMTSSPDETSFSDEEEIPLPTEIILYSVVVLFGIMCVTSVLHSFARDCLGYTGQVQPEPQGGAEESATLQRRKILDIVFSETNLVSFIFEFFNCEVIFLFLILVPFLSTQLKSLVSESRS